MDKRFEDIVENEIKEIEKGYSDHPSDPQGKTRWGISEWLARAYSYKGKMSELPWVKAKEIYYKEYWERNKYYMIKNRAIAEEIFEQAINLPSVRFKGRNVLKANIHLQKSYIYTADKKIAVDGLIGSQTINAINDCNNTNLLYNMLNGLQAKHYFEIIEEYPHLKDFIRGWFNKRIKMKGVN